MSRILGAVLVMMFIAVTTVRASLPSVDLPIQEILPLSPLMPTRLQWDASPDPTVTGYMIYYECFVGETPILDRIDVGPALSATLPLFVGREYTIFVVAYDSAGTIGFPSTFLKYAPPPIAGLTLKQHSMDSLRVQCRTSPLAMCRIEYSETLDSPEWKPLSLVTADFQGNVSYVDVLKDKPAARFYRIVRF